MKTNEPTSESVNSLTNLGGDFTFPNSSLTVKRMGYGAMQLAGPGVWGPPKDPGGAVAVLHEAIALGINHIDTSDFYGPHVTNQIIREALHPYPEDLVIVTKVGARRGDDKSWIHTMEPTELMSQIHDNLRNLKLEAMDVVNLRAPGMAAPDDSSIAEALGALAGLQKEGLIRHIGLSNVSRKQIAEAEGIAEIVCVQNYYNIAHREDDVMIDELAARGIAYVPFFPLGGFSPLQSASLEKAAAELETTPLILALAWLLRRSPNMLLIPGTSSVKHLLENVQAATLEIPDRVMKELDGIAASAKE